jgi:type 1 glutamine amidotransferase
MNDLSNRREFLQTAALAGASLLVPEAAFGAKKKSVLVFTKSSGFEHDVVKIKDDKPSIVQTAVTMLGGKHGFDVVTSKDGRVFDSGDFRKHAAVLFFTTGDLTTGGTDKNPAMSLQGKQSLLDAIHDGLGFVGIHAAADTFHTPPDTPDNANRYIAHGEQSDPYIRMLGGEFIAHGRTPRLQMANIIVDDSKFPGLEGVSSPVSLNDEWYSLKDFRTDLHVILTLDTKGMTGEPYQRAPYPMTWARMEGKGRVFYTAIGDRPENWSNTFFLDLLGGGIRWSIGDAQASLGQNLTEAAPGYAEIPPKPKS